MRKLQKCEIYFEISADQFDVLTVLLLPSVYCILSTKSLRPVWIPWHSSLIFPGSGMLWRPYSLSDSSFVNNLALVCLINLNKFLVSLKYERSFASQYKNGSCSTHHRKNQFESTAETLVSDQIINHYVINECQLDNELMSSPNFISNKLMLAPIPSVSSS